MGIAEALRRELGAGNVLEPGDERLVDYGRDESDLYEPHLPDCVARVGSRAEIEAVVARCREAGVPLTPRGAGSGKVGGCVPVDGGVVLSTERMAAVREISPEHNLAVVEPGVILGALQDEVEAAGLFYPPDPASLSYCTIGGNVATNAGGPRAFKYGVTREYVLGVEAVTMAGEVLRLGRRTAKGVTGYDLVAGLVGSEGTLAIISEVTLKLVPRPPAVSTALAVFADHHAAGRAVSAILRSGYRPRVLELLDRHSIDLVRPESTYRFPTGAGAALLVELDGDPEGLDAALIRAGELCGAAGAVELLVAQSAVEQRALWQARRNVSVAMRKAYPFKISEDICVPRGALGELLARVDAIGRRFDIATASYGHAGDGNLHANLLLDAPPTGAVAARLEAALEQMFKDTLELGGTLSGEHGIGVMKRRFLHLEHGPAVLDLERRFKALWDPTGLLNPGKILPAAGRGCVE
jgi:glycolate oxidase